MANELQQWFEALPGNLEAEVADEFAQIVDEELVGPIRDAARQGKTGNLKASVRKEEGSNEVEWIVEAGGPLTTKNIRDGASAEYDYALAEEFGNSHQPAYPFFYGTARARAQRVHDRVEDLVGRKIDKL